jgi:catechol 2,3-dioxygenase-like lactoylglutathione lyase family enzyme
MKTQSIKLNSVLVGVRDIKKSVKFYESVFGVTFLKSDHHFLVLLSMALSLISKKFHPRDQLVGKKNTLVQQNLLRSKSKIWKLS